ncbi:hypothetical protein KIN20_018090 [Parelaphostrongylus tenuis]|uniref:Uncharacterized protein n=1 Tax=Parelaphostrongylus tenuis TaxID=148309 RepID=A0AAD5QRV8_PARTN|nr:hypothetical protein KIN20_018090 [Parelaphostrongylus tenuis]
MVVKVSKIMGKQQLLQATHQAKDEIELSTTPSLDDLIFVSLNGTAIESNCPISQIEECAPGKYRPSPKAHKSCSLMLAQWASFLYDDLAHVASNQLTDGSKNSPLPCCNKSVEHPECFPITGLNGECRDDVNDRQVNPTWSDEQLFQESRRIIIAQIQHITYSEFIPVIVGKENLKKYSLDLHLDGYDSRYDINIDASTFNFYAAAVGQFFITLLPNKISLTDSFGSNRKEESLGKLERSNKA